MPEALFALAERQYGVISRAQALATGMPASVLDRRVAQRRLEPVHPGVYRIPGSPRTGRQRAMAATLWLGEAALVSHLTAATLLRLDGCKARELHVSVPRSTVRRTTDDLTLHRSNDLPRRDRVVVDGIPCTSATRTILDCAAVLDDEALEVAFESARRMGLTAPMALQRRADEWCGSGRPGASAIRKLVALQQPGSRALEYRLEVKLARLLRGSGLPQPVRQYRIGPYRVDFAYPMLRFGVEPEGFDYHGYRLAWRRDRRRTAWFERRGWRLMVVTWDDVTKRPAETLERIALQVLGASDRA
jgi:very-short-patch-repair endonuclease